MSGQYSNIKATSAKKHMNIDKDQLLLENHLTI